MAKDFITGLKLTANSIEWTSLERGKDKLVSVDTRRVEAVTTAPVEGDTPPSGSPDPLPGLIAANAKHLAGSITLGMAADQILMRVVKLPAVSDEELGGMVMLQVDKLSPFPVENMVVSYEIMDKGKETCLVLIAAAKNDVVDVPGKLLAAADIFPSRVDANVLGWWQLLKDAGQINKSGRQIVILLADAVPDIIVFQDGIPLAFRCLSEQGPLTDEEFASEIARETANTLMSQEMEHGPSAHCLISVWHRSDMPVSIEEALRRECPCELTLNSLESIPQGSEGLARRTAQDGQLLDLTPAMWRSAGKEKRFRQRMYVAAGILAGIWALSVILFVGGMFYQQKKLATLKAEADLTLKPAKEVMDMRRRVAIITRYSDRTYSALECLREVTKLQPEGVDLDSFDYKRTSSGTPTVTVNGKASSVEQVYAFKNGLDASKLFSKGTIKGPFEQKGKQAFQIDLKLPIGGEE